MTDTRSAPKNGKINERRDLMEEATEFVSHVVGDKSRRIGFKLIPHGKKGGLEGVFSDPQTAVAQADETVYSQPSRKFSLYACLNPLKEDKDITNTMTPKARGEGISTGDIKEVRAFVIDIDPPAGTPYPSPASTVRALRMHAQSAFDAARGAGLPMPIVLMTGNGVQAVYRVEAHAPVTKGEATGRAFIRFWNTHFGHHIPESAGVIDTTVGSVMQLVRVPGSINWKNTTQSRLSIDDFRRAHIHKTSKPFSTGIIGREVLDRILEWAEENNDARKAAQRDGLDMGAIENLDDEHPIESRLIRARAYVKTWGSVGRGGRRSFVFAQAQKLVHGLLIPISHAADIIHEEWNRHQPEPLPRGSDGDSETLDYHVNAAKERGHTIEVGALIAERKLDDKVAQVLDEQTQRWIDSLSRRARVESTSENLAIAYAIAERNSKRAPTFNENALPENLVRAPGENNILNDLIDTIQKSSSSASLAGPLMSAVTVASAALGKWVSPPLFRGSKSHCGLWLLNVSGTGVGKNAPLDAVKRILAEAGLSKALCGSSLTSKASLIKQLAWCQNTASVFTFDEAGELFERVTSPVSHSRDLPAIFKNVYNTALLVENPGAETMRALVSAKAPGVDENASKVLIERPVLSMVGATTSNQIQSMFSGKRIMDGFANRWLVLSDGEIDVTDEEEDPFGVVPADVRTPSHVRSWIQKAGRVQLMADDETDIFPFSSDLVNVADMTTSAQERQLDFMRETNKLRIQLIKTGAEQHAAILARTAENALRLATISCAGRTSNPYQAKLVIDEDDVLWAHAIALHAAKTFSSLMIKTDHGRKDTFGAKYDSVIDLVRRDWAALDPIEKARGRPVLSGELKDLTRKHTTRDISDVLDAAVTTGDVYIFRGAALADICSQLEIKRGRHRFGVLPILDTVSRKFAEQLRELEERTSQTKKEK